MHVELLQVLLIGRLVVFCAETRHSFFAEVRFHRVYTFKEHVEPQIEFLIVHEKRICDIALDKDLLGLHLLGQVGEPSHEENALAAVALRWLAYERLFSPAFLYVLFKFGQVVRQHE